MKNIYNYKNKIVLTNGSVVLNSFTKNIKIKELSIDNYNKNYLSSINNKKVKNISKDTKSALFLKKLNI